MSPLTIKLLTAGGLVGLFLFARSSAAAVPPAPAPIPPAPPPPAPAPIPRGIPDRVNPEAFPVDQIAGPGYPVRRRRYGFGWY